MESLSEATETALRRGGFINRPEQVEPVPWACVTCGRWVLPVQRIYTDEGLFHDKIACLSTDRFEELVLKYGCKCVDVVSPHVVAVQL